MKVRTLIPFNDYKKFRKNGEEFEVTEERLEAINSTSHGNLVELIDDKVKDKNPKQMNKEDLLLYAKEKGIDLDIKMSKAEMLNALK